MNTKRGYEKNENELRSTRAKFNALDTVFNLRSPFHIVLTFFFSSSSSSSFFCFFFLRM